MQHMDKETIKHIENILDMIKVLGERIDNTNKRIDLVNKRLDTKSNYEQN